MAVTASWFTRRWQALLQRGVDTASEVADVVAGKLSALADPRARLLRKRRWALRLGLFFCAGCLFWGLVTALLAAWGWFVLVLVITGSIAVVQVIPATLLLFRYRWLRSLPLPGASTQRSTNAGRLPPRGSAARSTMFALGASERGLFSLLGVMERGNMVPAGEIRDLTAAANQTSADMAATAAEVVSLEQAVQCSAQARAYLTPTINAFTEQLNTGLHQYSEMVSAAAQLVSSARGQSMSAPAQYRDEPAGAADRLAGWAQAFEELGGLPRA
jgi:hypothetical protein